ncbi:Gfo/Idh/MocA family protein [Marinivivus vitaminiproducens]|uniref:Gfo/Idh/MocA family protein n=1 Tax=Marinivivus vitaminiproducens TaxID=3035935 RepID=UPI0027A231D2|nr:Gfo/Idh/MocA family oxidoreductase [Geminicoccaceae bacterium SCSIO 64248]
MRDEGKRRVALVGTGHRGTGMWGKELIAECGAWADLVALCDRNPLRLERARQAVGVEAALYTDLAAMLREVKPETVIVCTPDVQHDDDIVLALGAGADVITEKPMATTAAKCGRILDAEKRTGRRVDVAFNYRYSPTAQRLKELLISGVIGEVTSVDFHWYLDTKHGADYFRRWHANLANSGSLFVHKATHHFDLLNWYLESDPTEVFARGSLRHYGRNGPFRGPRCRACPHAPRCDYYMDISADPWLDMLYEDPSAEDGYVRDACVFREEIDIPDTMSANILYESGAQVSYSLNTYMPIEGHHLAFNGTKGRIEIRQYERQRWTVPPADEILLMRNFTDIERIWVQHREGGHHGGDRVLHAMLFRPGMEDPLGQRASARAGAVSVLTGVAAVESMRADRSVRLDSLLALPSRPAQGEAPARKAS